MTFVLALATRTRRLQVIANDLNAAASPGQLLLYTGAQPAVGASTTQNLQCTITLAAPSATVSGNVLTFTAGESGLRARAETITWARLVDGNGNPVADGTVSVPGAGGDFQISSVSGYVGATIVLTSGVITE